MKEYEDNNYHFIAENMKCCGNCLWRDAMDNGEYYIEECKIYKYKILASYEYCPKWVYDELTLEDRVII